MSGLVTLLFLAGLVMLVRTLQRAGQARRRAEQAQARMEELERALVKVRQELVELRAGHSAPAVPGPLALPPMVALEPTRPAHLPTPAELPPIVSPPPRELVLEAIAAPLSEPVLEAQLAPPPAAAPLPQLEEPVVEALPVAPPPRPPLPARGSADEAAAAVARYSAWREVLRPFLLENIGWFIGGFLVIAGSLYFIREAWGSIAAVGRHALLIAVLLGYGAGFVGVGLWLRRQKALATASRAMAYVGLSLLPVAMLQTANLFALSHFAWAVALPLLVAAAYPVAYLAGGLLDRPLARPLAAALCTLLALEGLVPLAAALSPSAALALPYLAWAVVHAQSTTTLRGPSAPSTAVLSFHLAALVYALLFVLGLAHALVAPLAGAPPLPAAYGPLAALFSLTALRVDVELRARWQGAPEIDAAVVAAFATTFAGVAIAARDPSLFALSAGLAAALFSAALRWYRRPLLLAFALTCASATSFALLFLAPPLATLRALAAEAAQAAGLLPARFGAWAFLLLPLAELSARLARRFAARSEPRLARSAELARWVTLAAVVAFALSPADAASAAPTLLGAAALLAVWHARRSGEPTAWAGAIALGAGAALFALRFGAASQALAAAGLVLFAAALPGLRRAGARPGSSALLAAALASAVASLLSAAAWSDPFWVAALGLLTAVSAAAAIAFASALPGAASALAASLLLAVALFGRGYAGALRSDPSLLWLLVPAAQCALAVSLRAAARRLRGRVPWRLAGWRLPLAARSLHALSEPLLWSAFASAAVLSVRGLVALDARGAALLAGAGALALLLGALGPAKRTAGALAAAAFTAAGMLSALALLGQNGGQAALGAVIAAAAVTALARAVRWRKLGVASAALAETSSALLTFSAVGALVVAAPVVWCLFGPRSPALDGLGCAALALVVAAGALLALHGSKPGARVGFALLLCLPGAAVVAAPAAGLPLYAIATVLAALAVALLWLERALRGKEGLAGNVASTLTAGAPLLAVLALGASFLPPPETFAAPLRADGSLHLGHLPADLLLVAFLLSALAARGGPVFLHLLFAELIVFATRARLALGIPTRGHGMVLAGGALLLLALGLRKKPRYLLVPLLWCSAALALGWARMLFGGPLGPLPPDTAEWAWALAAGLLAVPLARLFWQRASSIFAAAAVASSLLAGASQLFPAWFARGGWVVAAAALALSFALLALAAERLEAMLAPFCAPRSLAAALRQVGMVLALCAAVLPAAAGVATVLRLQSPQPLALAIPAAIALALCAASAHLVLRSSQPAVRPLLLASVVALALGAVATSLFEPWFGAAAPVAALAGLALVARAGGKIPALRGEAERLAPALWVAALFATRARPDEWTTAAALALGALLVPGHALPAAVAAIAPRTVLVLGGFGFALSWAGARSAVAGELGVLAGLGAATVAAAWLHELSIARGGQLSRTRSSALLFAGSALLVVAGAAAPLPARALAVEAGALLAAALLLLRALGRASAAPAANSLALALVALGALYCYGRAQLGLGAGLAGLDRNVALGAALLFLLLERALARPRPDLGRTLLAASAVLPLLALPGAFLAGYGALAPAAAAAALLYGLIAWMHQSRGAAYLGLLLANAFFFATWQRTGVADAQLYAIPLGASLLLAAQLSRRDLPRPQLQALRSLGCVVLYAGSAWQMLGSDALLFPLLLVGLALATVVLGVLLQVRAFVYLGTGALVMTVLGNLVRYSARSTRILAVTVTLSGLAIMAAMAYFSVRREQALALYRRLVRGMEEWE